MEKNIYKKYSKTVADIAPKKLTNNFCKLRWWLSALNSYNIVVVICKKLPPVKAKIKTKYLGEKKEIS